MFGSDFTEVENTTPSAVPGEKRKVLLVLSKNNHTLDDADGSRLWKKVGCINHSNGGTASKLSSLEN